MVKLSVSTEVSKDKLPLKEHLDDTYEAPIEKETVVHLRPKPRCTKYAVGVAIAILIIISVGGALLGVFLYKRHESGSRCIDWGPGCELKEPPIFTEHHDHRNHGGDNGNKEVDIEFHLGLGHVVGSDKTNHDNDGDTGRQQDHQPPHKLDDPHSPGAPHDRDGYHPNPSRSGHRLPPKNQRFPPVPAAGSKDKERHHGHKRHHQPIP